MLLLNLAYQRVDREFGIYRTVSTVLLPPYRNLLLVVEKYGG